MRFYSLVLVFVFILTLPSAAKSADDGKISSGILKISLEKAIEMAVRESEDVRVKRNEIRKTDYMYKEAFSDLYPHFNGEIKYNYYPGVRKINVDLGIPGIPAEDVKLQGDFDLGIGVKMEQVLYTFGRIRNAVMAADNARKASRFEKESAQREVSYSTALSYIATLLAQKTIEIVKASFENANDTKKILDRRFAYGRIPKADNIKARADIAARVPMLKRAESGLDLAMRNLKVLIGVSEETELKLTDDLVRNFPDYSVNDALNDMMNIEPTLKALERNIMLSENIAALQKAEYYPTINGIASYTYFGESDKAYIGGSNMQHLGTLGVVLSIPLWNGNAKYAVYKQSEMDKLNAELQHKKAVKYYSLELRNAISEYKSLKATYKAHLEAQNLSEQSFKAAQDRFKAGKMSLTDLNDAELQWANSKLNTVVSLYDINEAIAKIERLISGEGEKSWKKRVLN